MKTRKIRMCEHFLLIYVCYVTVRAAIDVFTQMLALFEANYPETLKVCWVINGKS